MTDVTTPGGTTPAPRHAGPHGPVVRPATPDDVAEIDGLVRELAAYEREPDAVTATPADLHEVLFGADPVVVAHVAEAPAGSGRRIDGVALWFRTYSTWEGRVGIHLEDLYVREEARGRGLGGALLRSLAQVAVERGYRRVEWAVLTWNEPAIGFYRSIGAAPLEDWRTYRLDGEALARYGAPTPR